MKQHYIPEVFLDNFSFIEEGDLYYLRIKPTNFKRKIRPINISGVCYEKDIYTFACELYMQVHSIGDKHDTIKAKLRF